MTGTSFATGDVIAAGVGIGAVLGRDIIHARVVGARKNDAGRETMACRGAAGCCEMDLSPPRRQVLCEEVQVRGDPVTG